MPKLLRKAWLYKSFNFWCQCQRCQFEGEQANECTNCHKKAEDGKKFAACGKCKKAWYCGVACQKDAWKKGHKIICLAGHSQVIPPEEYKPQTQLLSRCVSCFKPAQLFYSRHAYVNFYGDEFCAANLLFKKKKLHISTHTKMQLKLHLVVIFKYSQTIFVVLSFLVFFIFLLSFLVLIYGDKNAWCIQINIPLIMQLKEVHYYLHFQC